MVRHLGLWRAAFLFRPVQPADADGKEREAVRTAFHGPRTAWLCHCGSAFPAYQWRALPPFHPPRRRAAADDTVIAADIARGARRYLIAPAALFRHQPRTAPDPVDAVIAVLDMKSE